MKGILIAGALAALLPTAALAANASVTGYGPRIGLSVDPDQLTFGGQLHVGEIAPSLTFDPNLEIGLGDHITTIQPNFDLQYHFDIANSVWKPYAGGGLGIAFYSWDAGGPGGSSDTSVGGNLVVGAEAPTRSGDRFFGELRFGLGDLPSLKIMVGWNFKM